MTDARDSLVTLVTALADDELVIGHRHSEWTGHAPHIEEDVAFSSIAQDEIGHATGLYSIVAGETRGDVDRLALGRDSAEYRHAILCERPNNEWGYTLARHWLYDTADQVRLEALDETAHEPLRHLVTKIRREERYHQLHADTWLKRVARGPVEGRSHLIAGLSAAWPDALALFEPIELEDEAVKHGWLPVPSSEQLHRFADRAGTLLDELGLPTEHTGVERGHAAEFIATSSGDLIETDDEDDEVVVDDGGRGGRRGRHTTDWQPLWNLMTVQYRDHPGATW